MVLNQAFTALNLLAQLSSPVPRTFFYHQTGLVRCSLRLPSRTGSLLRRRRRFRLQAPPLATAVFCSLLSNLPCQSKGVMKNKQTSKQRNKQKRFVPENSIQNQWTADTFGVQSRLYLFFSSLGLFFILSYIFFGFAPGP